MSTRRKTPKQLRESLRRVLVQASGGCSLQQAADGSNWPCGTCFMDALNRLGLDDTHPHYHQRNDPPDRHNEVWRAILQIRDADL